MCQRQRPARPSAWPPSALAGDILALWAAPTTTVADRKRPLRAVIESVQVTGLFRLYQAAGGKTERQCVTTSRPVQWFAVSHPSRRYPLDQMGVGQARPPPARPPPRIEPYSKSFPRQALDVHSAQEIWTIRGGPLLLLHHCRHAVQHARRPQALSRLGSPVSG